MHFPDHMTDRVRGYLDGASVCVTGGAGFIGGHLVDALLNVGARVTVIDDLSNSSLANLSEHIERVPSRVRFVHGSILDPEALSDALADVSVVFHQAAVGSVQISLEDPERSWQVNALGTLRVLDTAARLGARRVVYASSSSAYGDVETLPKREDAQPAPASPYAASKLAGEHLCHAWSKTMGVSAVSLRYFNVFGPRQLADSPYSAVVAAFARRLLAGEAPIIFGDGQQTRDFTFIDNAVLANLLAADPNCDVGGEVINIGVGERFSLLELAQTMSRVCGDCPSYTPILKDAREGDVRHSLADITKARTLLGYEPIVSFAEGLAQTCQWYQDVLERA